MKIILFGSTGLLGNAFYSELRKDSRFQLITPSRNDLDLNEFYQVRKIFESHKPELVINCAAYTDVDGAEANQQECWSINTDLPSFFAEAADEFNSHVIHFSTDYIFDGLATTPYFETSTPNPINFYGKSKLEGETNLISRFGSSATIIRTAWLYGRNKKTFVDHLIDQITKGEKTIKVVDDQVGQLTNVNLVAVAVLNMISQGIENYVGIWNITSQEFASWHEIATLIDGYFGSQSQLVGVSSDSLNRVARRPKFSALDASKFESIFYKLPTWQENLTNYLKKGYRVGGNREI
jgi:dTDP-4-dehydrorhamnose reductase